MSKRNIIRKNDFVVIVNPEVVIRCGYPLCKQAVKDTMITPEQKEALYALLRAFELPTPRQEEIKQEVFGDILELAEPDLVAHDKILDILAYNILIKKQFGGKERKLYTERRESLRNATGEVIEKKVVQSGTYHAGGANGGYGDDYDYEPPYLSIDKAHVLCRVYVHWKEGICQNVNTDGGVWIENINLQKQEQTRLEPAPQGHIDIERLRQRLAEFERAET